MLREFPLVRACEAEKQDDTPALFTGLDDDVFRDKVTTSHIADPMGFSLEDEETSLVEVNTASGDSDDVEPPVEGASVNLSVRALAIEAIMRHYNYRAKLQGVSRIRPVSDNRFDTHYRSKGRNPDAQQDAMRGKDYHLEQSAVEAFHTLNATDAMRKAGFSEVAIIGNRHALEREMSDYLPGVSNADKRSKVVKKVSNTAARAMRLR